VDHFLSNDENNIAKYLQEAIQYPVMKATVIACVESK